MTHYHVPSCLVLNCDYFAGYYSHFNFTIVLGYMIILTIYLNIFYLKFTITKSFMSANNVHSVDFHIWTV